MLVRETIEARMEALPNRAEPSVQVRLPLSLKRDPVPVRTGLLQRLASSRQFALGDRSGVLRAAQGRSGRPLRLDVRQRVIVKALVSRHVGKGMARGAVLAAHVRYLGRDGAGEAAGRAGFFDRAENTVEAGEVTRPWADDRHHFRFIVSPEHGDRIADLRSYVRQVMDRVSADLGEPGLTWIATCHHDTDQPHAHVLVRGRRGDGRDLVIPRDYIGYGFRARAQEVAQERLGDLSRVEAERRIWKETQADRFTAFDRRLMAAADSQGLVDDGVGANDAWAALTRGRLRHLEALGLAVRAGRRYRLDAGMESSLRSLQLKRDVIRTMNQRRLEGARQVRMLGTSRVRGVVVKTGFHDEAGAVPFVVVRDGAGVEHYARLRAGTTGLMVGKTLVLAPLANGLAGIDAGRGGDLAR